MLTRFISASLCVGLLSACAGNNPASDQPLQTTSQMPNTPTVALVLGGGGGRGLAHIGVIESLENHGIRPDLVVGTSAGAIVGSIYASGKNSQELKQLSHELMIGELVDFTPSSQGLIEGKKLRQYINEQVNHQAIERLPTRFAAVATSLHDKQTVHFTQGETGLAVQASASIPKLFIPPRIPENGGKKYIDGSSTALVPARVAKSLGADVIISVDVMAKAVPTPKAQPKKADDKQPVKAGMNRHAQGVDIVWGDDKISIPVNLDKLNAQDSNSPFNLPVGDILGMVLDSLPKNIEISLPEAFPNQLPTNPQEVWQLLNQVGAEVQADPADLAASDIIIRPSVFDISVFDITEQDKLIQAGKVATDAQIDAINQAIHQATLAKKQSIPKTN